MAKAEDRVIDLDRFGGDDVGHGNYLEAGKEIQEDVVCVVCGVVFKWR